MQLQQLLQAVKRIALHRVLAERIRADDLDASITPTGPAVMLLLVCSAGHHAAMSPGCHCSSHYHTAMTVTLMHSYTLFSIGE
jgi:hypothetical protein